jgi:predicted NUDIX family NTP pyrophosphohydrolase
MSTARAVSLPKTSAGILLFRRKSGSMEVLLGHPGGPFWKKKDHGAWSIPKGLISFGEAALDAAKREFEEETGHRPRGEFTSLGEAKQPGGKTVHVWAAEMTGIRMSSRATCFRWNGRRIQANTKHPS